MYLYFNLHFKVKLIYLFCSCLKKKYEARYITLTLSVRMMPYGVMEGVAMAEILFSFVIGHTSRYWPAQEVLSKILFEIK